MSISLSLENNSWWYAFITHSFWKRSMIRAIIVHFIWILWKRNTILAFLIRFMLLFAFIFYFKQVMLKTFMFNISQSILGLCTIHTPLTRRMIATKFNFLHWIFSHTQTINAFTIWTMSTMWFLYCFFWQYFWLLFA